ncbi:MAG: prefoldin subunit beta [Candidatus Thermoplasmatota archaeon]
MEVSEELQAKIAHFQQLQQQVQYVAAQRIQLTAQMKETERALEELGKQKEGTVYRSIGSLLVKVEDLAGLKKELEDQKEAMEIRIRTMERQEKHLREQYQEMQSSLEKELGAAGQAG